MFAEKAKRSAFPMSSLMRGDGKWVVTGWPLGLPFKEIKEMGEEYLSSLEPCLQNVTLKRYV